MKLRILKQIFGSKALNKNSENISEQAKQSTYAKLEQIIELGKIVSGNNEKVVSALDLFVNDIDSYFNTYENDLFQRGVEDSSQISAEIALIDSLLSVNKIVYVDHATEGNYVLVMLDNLVDGALSKHEDFEGHSNAYQSKGRNNTIGNFIDHKDFSPSPQNLTEKAGFQLLSIDERSDSYAFF